MTKKEFIENITEWCELINVCNEYDIDICDDIFAEESLDEIVKARWDNGGWQGVACCLAKIDWLNDDYYRLNGYGNLENVNYNDFEMYKKDVLADMEQNGYFDEDEDDIDDEECDNE